MIRIGLILSLLLTVVVLRSAAPPQSTPNRESLSSGGPQYASENRLMFPANYREWIYLSSGVNMNYNPAFQKMDHTMFDNVFVNPEAFKSFQQTGMWPDKTMLVLEVRMAGDHASINKDGHFQTPEIMGIEVHVKDEARFPGKWAFYGFDEKKPSTAFAKDMPCYSCHEQHGAVDTTFAQFYPTLIAIAKKKGTLSAAYLKEEAEGAAGEKREAAPNKP
jgi:hypothetical protein